MTQNGAKTLKMAIEQKEKYMENTDKMINPWIFGLVPYIPPSHGFHDLSQKKKDVPFDGTLELRKVLGSGSATDVGVRFIPSQVIEWRFRGGTPES